MLCTMSLCLQCKKGCQECSSLTPILKHILQHLSDQSQHEFTTDVTVSHSGFKQKLSWYFECEHCRYKSFYHEDIVEHAKIKHRTATGKLFPLSLLNKTSSSKSDMAWMNAKRMRPSGGSSPSTAAKRTKSRPDFQFQGELIITYSFIGFNTKYPIFSKTAPDDIGMYKY